MLTITHTNGEVHVYPATNITTFEQLLAKVRELFAEATIKSIVSSGWAVRFYRVSSNRVVFDWKGKELKMTLPTSDDWLVRYKQARELL